MKQHANSVGTSGRTPLKHWVLDTLLGREVGVLSRFSRNVPVRAVPYFLVVDLCAGDGMEECSSPWIIVKHCRWFLAARKGLRVRMEFYEKNGHTYDDLSRNLLTYASDVHDECHVINGDAGNFRLEAADRQAVFINCDPNHIQALPLTDGLISTLTKGTTMIVTLGCNVGGLMRMPPEDRSKWYDRVLPLIDKLPKWHDALLVELLRDASKWAYLLRVPKVWSDDDARRIKRKGDALFPGKGVRVASYRSDPRGFHRMLDALFLRRDEYKELYGGRDSETLPED